MIELIASLGGLVIPPAFDFVKKMFLGPDKDTPEATLSSLATTSPEVMPQYIEALATQMKARAEFFNRDVIGSPSQWVVDLRAAIRPIGVVLSFGLLALHLIPEADVNVTEGVRAFCEMTITSWFGSRFVSK